MKDLIRLLWTQYLISGSAQWIIIVKTIKEPMGPRVE